MVSILNMFPDFRKAEKLILASNSPTFSLSFKAAEKVLVLIEQESTTAAAFPRLRINNHSGADYHQVRNLDGAIVNNVNVTQFQPGQKTGTDRQKMMMLIEHNAEAGIITLHCEGLIYIIQATPVVGQTIFDGFLELDETINRIDVFYHVGNVAANSKIEVYTIR